ncbi:MAG: LLM class F420-dependent oxidoreductase [bacterium]|nr:LLM class F420-dependent oxidoreductase [bacterium]
MKIGLQLTKYDWPKGPAKLARTLRKIAREAEQAQFYSLWVLDHFFQMEGAGRAEDAMLEAYTQLGYLAGVTRQIKLGVLVTGVIYRYPGILAKTISTLDVLSEGRAYLGIGAAWYEREAVGLGIPFPPLAERFEQLEETLQILKQMWSGKNSRFAGKHFQLNETINNPQPISQPHPPILIGGAGEKKTLRLVALYGDACNFDADMGIDGLRHKLHVLRGHCEEVGRDFDSIEKTVVTHARPEEDPQATIDQCRAFAEAGFTHAMFNMRGVETLRPIEIFGENIIPTVAAF